MILSDNIRGASLMLGAMTCFTLNDACMKALAEDLPLFQALLLRSVGVIVGLGLLSWRSGAFRMAVGRKDRGKIAWRSFLEMGAAFFFITALFNMPLANVTAIVQALPLTVSLAGAVFLGEPIGWRRLVAIGIGFLGVLLIIRPGGEGFTIYSIYALLAVLCITMREVATRGISSAIPSMRIALWAAIAVALFSCAGMMVSAPPVPVSVPSGLLLIAATGLIICAYICSVAAMRVGEISFVSPMRYASLLVALVAGWFAFGEWPSSLTLLGAAIVVFTGLYTFYREVKLQPIG